jgi:hypothetical protein
MAKYRVIERDGKFIPQYKGWFGWKNYYEYNICGEVEYTDIISFQKDNEAIDYLLDQTKYMSRKAYDKVIFAYEE